MKLKIIKNILQIKRRRTWILSKNGYLQVLPSDPQITCRLAPVEDPIKFSSTSSGQSFGHEDESADLPDPTCFFNFFFFITDNDHYKNVKYVQLVHFP